MGLPFWGQGRKLELVLQDRVDNVWIYVVTHFDLMCKGVELY